MLQKDLNVAIILAGGKSTRFNDNTDINGSTYKQKLLQPMSNGLTVLQNSFTAFAKTSCFNLVIVPSYNSDIINSLKRLKDLKTPIYFCEGGQTRFLSLVNAIEKLQQIKSQSYQNYQDCDINLLIHDGARPLVSTELIDSVKKATSLHKACVVPIVKPVDSVKILNNETQTLSSKLLNRDTIGLAQTPQGFNLAFLKDCLSKITDLNRQITDDVSLAQIAKQECYFIEGSRQNIKITSKEDLDIANFLLSKAL